MIITFASEIQNMNFVLIGEVFNSKKLLVNIKVKQKRNLFMSSLINRFINYFIIDKQEQS